MINLYRHNTRLFVKAAAGSLFISGQYYEPVESNMMCISSYTARGFKDACGRKVFDDKLVLVCEYVYIPLEVMKSLVEYQRDRVMTYQTCITMRDDEPRMAVVIPCKITEI